MTILTTMTISTMVIIMTKMTITKKMTIVCMEENSQLFSKNPKWKAALIL